MNDRIDYGLNLNDNRVHGTSGNAFRDQWLAERTPGELRRLQALAMEEGVRISGGTILRPQLYPQRQETISATANRTGILTYYFPYYAFIERITATVRGIQLVNGESPDPYFAGSDTVSPLNYIEGRLERTTREDIFTDFLPLSEWAGKADDDFVFNILPFVTQNETLQIDFRVADAVESIELLNITLVIRRFPLEGY